MTENLWDLAFWSFALSGVISYAGWSRLRVILIRQKMFEIRDRLCDAAIKHNALDDPAYLDARETLQALIRRAHSISLPVLAWSYWKQRGTPSPAEIESQNPELQKEIEAALCQSAMALFEYVYYYRPFSGVLWHKALLTIFNAKETVSQWFKGGGPTRLDYTMKHCQA